MIRILVFVIAFNFSIANAATRIQGITGKCRTALAAAVVCLTTALPACYTIRRGDKQKDMENTEKSLGERQASRLQYLDYSYDDVERLLDGVQSKLDDGEVSDSNLRDYESDLKSAKDLLEEIRPVITTPLKDYKGIFLAEDAGNLSNDFNFFERVYGRDSSWYWDDRKTYRLWSLIGVAPVAYLLPEFLGVMILDGVVGWSYTGPLNFEDEIERLAGYQIRLAELEARVAGLKSNATRNPANWLIELQYSVIVPTVSLEIYLANFAEAQKMSSLPGAISEELAEANVPEYLRRHAGSRFNSMCSDLEKDILAARSPDLHDRGYIEKKDIQILGNTPLDATRTSIEIKAILNVFLPKSGRAEILQKIAGPNGINSAGVEFASNAPTRRILFRATYTGTPATVGSGEPESTSPNPLELELRQEFGSSE